MSNRRQLWIDGDIVETLWTLAKCKKAPDGGRPMTADELADQMLKAAVRQQYPQLLEHRKKVNAMERELLKELVAKEGVSIT